MNAPISFPQLEVFRRRDQDLFDALRSLFQNIQSVVFSSATGRAVLTGGRVLVRCEKTREASNIIVSYVSFGTNHVAGASLATPLDSRKNGISFVIVSDNPLEDSTVDWRLEN